MLAGIGVEQGSICLGPTHAHHAGRKPGTALKAPDNTAIPFCAKHHREWHDANGFFTGWLKIARREGADCFISRTRAQLRVNLTENVEGTT